MSEQRAEFQFSLIKSNLGASGALMAFALNPASDYHQALLVVPVVSFTLFCLWMHHALVIRLGTKDAYTPSPHPFWEFLRRLTFSLSILVNFALIPTGALLLYNENDLQLLRVTDIILLAIVFVLYGLWFYLQYWKQDLQKAGE